MVFEYTAIENLLDKTGSKSSSTTYYLHSLWEGVNFFDVWILNQCALTLPQSLEAVAATQSIYEL